MRERACRNLSGCRSDRAAATVSRIKGGAASELNETAVQQSFCRYKLRGSRVRSATIRLRLIRLQAPSARERELCRPVASASARGRPPAALLRHGRTQNARAVVLCLYHSNRFRAVGRSLLPTPLCPPVLSPLLPSFPPAVNRRRRGDEKAKEKQMAGQSRSAAPPHYDERTAVCTTPHTHSTLQQQSHPPTVDSTPTRSRRPAARLAPHRPSSTSHACHTSNRGEHC